MNSNGGHLRPDELNHWIDSGRAPEEIIGEHPHLRSCSRCQGILLELCRIDMALRGLPLPEPRRAFTEDVLVQVDLYAGHRSSGRMVHAGGSMLMLLAGMSVTAGCLLLAAASEAPRLEPGSPVEGVLRSVGSGVAESADWLVAHIGTLLDVRTMASAVLVLVGGIALGVLDRALSHRIGERVQSGG